MRLATLLLAALVAALAAACASKPPPPDWQMNARSAGERLLDAYFAGNQRVEAQELERMRSEIARTGRPELMARAELLRCAAQVASLDFGDCPAYRALEADAAAPERAYAAFLAGRAGAGDITLLPEVQRALAAAHAPSAADAAALRTIDDPLARLVAAGVLLERGQAHPAIFEVAVDTASAQGWRRPLMAWLRVQLQRAESAGDSAEKERLKRRLALVEGPPR